MIRHGERLQAADTPLKLCLDTCSLQECTRSEFSVHQSDEQKLAMDWKPVMIL